MRIHSSPKLPSTRVYIRELKISKRGPLYEARLGSPTGPILVESTLEPALAGSRALLARGITGRLEMWDGLRPFPRMIADIESAAALTVREDRGTSATFVRFKPLSPATGVRFSAETPAQTSNPSTGDHVALSRPVAREMAGKPTASNPDHQVDLQGAKTVEYE